MESDKEITLKEQVQVEIAKVCSQINNIPGREIVYSVLEKKYGYLIFLESRRDPSMDWIICFQFKIFTVDSESFQSSLLKAVKYMNCIHRVWSEQALISEMKPNDDVIVENFISSDLFMY